MCLNLFYLVTHEFKSFKRLVMPLSTQVSHLINMCYQLKSDIDAYQCFVSVIYKQLLHNTHMDSATYLRLTII